jgi:hypothetical protein
MCLNTGDILIVCSLAFFGLYFLWVIYKLFTGSKNYFAFTLLFFSGVWQIQWYFYILVKDGFKIDVYFNWGLPLQCWVFSNRYYHSYLKSNNTTHKDSLTILPYFTVIFSIMVVALCQGFGFTGNTYL